MTVPAVASQTGRDHGSTECDIYLECEEDDGAERMVGRPERFVQPFLAEDEQVEIRWREKEKGGAAQGKERTQKLSKNQEVTALVGVVVAIGIAVVGYGNQLGAQGGVRL